MECRRISSMLVKTQIPELLAPRFNRLGRDPRICIFLSGSAAGAFRYVLKTVILAQGFLVFCNVKNNLEHQLNVQFPELSPHDSDLLGLRWGGRNFHEPSRHLLSSLGTLLWGPLNVWQLCAKVGLKLEALVPIISCIVEPLEKF